MLVDRSILDALDRVIVAAVGATALALAGADRAGELTFPQWRVLVVVGDAPSGMHVSDIANRIGSSSPSASRLIRRMERAGLVTTQRDEEDRRATLVRLTRHGARLRSRVVSNRRRLVTRLFNERDGVLPSDLEPGLQMIADVLSDVPTSVPDVA